MLKIMLIDDEAPFRTGLKDLINWRHHGYEIIGEAANGKAALNKMAEKVPDILLVDMNMPVMNGADLIEQVSMKYPRVKSIGLSGYDDYDYLRKSMRGGAVDYLLKHNLTAETLLAALEAAAATIVREEKAEAINAKLEDQIEEHLDVLRHRFISELLEGILETDEQSARVQMESLELDLPLSGGSIILMLIDQFWRIKQSSDEKKLNTIVASVLSISSEILKEYSSSAVQKLDERTFIIFVPAGGQRSIMSQIDRQKAVISRIGMSIQRYLNLSTSFCAGKPYIGLEGLVQSYQQVRSLMDEHFYDGSGSIRYAGQKDNSSWQEQHESISLDIEVEKQLTSSIQMADAIAAEAALTHYFMKLYEQRASNKSFKIICIELIHLLGRCLREMNVITENSSYDPLDAYDRINRFDTVDDLKDWIIEKYKETVIFLRLHGLHERYTPVVSKALQFIHSSYQDQISLGDAAEFAGVSNSYLSRSFKDETGKGFSEYVTAYRIENACKMIKSGGRRIKDIASACGFQNYTYFFKVFKQTTGLTPNEYEAELKKSGI
ncbi:MAG: response regulator [Clostridiaceae bacterium]|nr:response regulator [Clostridiaceae bacterium]